MCMFWLQKERVYVFVRFGKQYILPMRNSLTTTSGVLKNYHGRILGIGECVSTAIKSVHLLSCRAYRSISILRIR